MAKSAILAIRIVANSSDAKRGLDDTSKSLDKFGKSAGKSAADVTRMRQQLDSISTGVLKAGAMATALGGATIAIAKTARAVAPLAGLLAVLPGAAGAAAAGVSVLKVATSGFADALKASGDPNKFAEATKDMAPAMRDAAVAMAQVNDQFAPTKRAVQQEFWGGMATDIRAVSSAYLPQVHRGMTSVAEVTRNMTAGIADGLVQASKFGAVESVFAAVYRVIDSIAPAMAPLTTGILRLVGASADLIYPLDGAAAAAERFDAWSQRIVANGQLAAWFNAGGDAAQALGDILGSVGQILWTVGQAALAAGGPDGGLGGFAQTLRLVAEEIRKPEIQSMLVSAFTQASQIISVVTSVIVALLPYLIAMGPSLMVIAAAWRVASGAVALFQGAIQIAGAAVAVFNAIAALNPLTLWIIAIAAVIAVIVVLYQRCEWFRTAVNAIFAAVGAFMAAAISSGVERAKWALEGLKAAADWVAQAVGGVFSWIYERGRDVQNFVSGLTGRWEQHVTIASALPEVVGAPFYMTAAALTFPTASLAPRVRDDRGPTTSIVVNGALDPGGVARQIKGILARDDRRDGRSAVGSGLW